MNVEIGSACGFVFKKYPVLLHVVQLISTRYSVCASRAGLDTRQITGVSI
jgi:hypothetical protein